MDDCPLFPFDRLLFLLSGQILWGGEVHSAAKIAFEVTSSVRTILGRKNNFPSPMLNSGSFDAPTSEVFYGPSKYPNWVLENALIILVSTVSLGKISHL